MDVLTSPCIRWWLLLVFHIGAFQTRSLPHGVVSVVDSPFNADPTGTKDSTTAFRNAIYAAYHQQLTLFVPMGRYMITDILNCTETKGINGFGSRNNPVVFVGEEGGDRPRIFLPDNTPGYTDRMHPKYLVFIGMLNLKHAYQPNENMNQIWRGIDIEIGQGNYGAVAIRHRAAQGGSIESITIYLNSGLTGVEGLAGSGGSHFDITVIGGRFGIDGRLTQPQATLSGITLIGQKCYPLIHLGLQTLVLVGANITIDKSSNTGVGVFVPEFSNDGTNTFGSGDCILPQHELDTQPPRPEDSGQTTIIDTVITTNRPTNTTTGILTSRSLLLNNVYFSENINTLVRFNGTYHNANGPDIIRQTTQTYSHITMAAVDVTPPPYVDWYHKHHGQPEIDHILSPIYINGDKQSKKRLVQLSGSASVPTNLVNQHNYITYTRFKSWQYSNVINVMKPPYNAKGDAHSDDYIPIQKALNDSAKTGGLVLLPKGVYLISHALVMPEGCSGIVGTNRVHTYVSVYTGTGDDVSEVPIVKYRQPLLVTSVSTKITVGWLSLVTRTFIDNVWCLHWLNTNQQSVHAQTHTERTHWYHALPPPPKHAPTINLTRPLNIISGSGRFYAMYQEDWVGTHTPEYRDVLFQNSNNIWCYHCNFEHGKGESQIEVRNSQNINLYGVKSEGQFPVLWVRDSSNVFLWGYGGNAEPLPFNSSYPPGYAQYPPTLFRVENSTNVLLGHLIDQVRTHGNQPMTGPGENPHKTKLVLYVDKQGKVYSSDFLERPVIYWIK